MKQLPLHQLHLARGAAMFEYQGWEIPRFFGDPAEEYSTLTRSVALVDLSCRGKLRVVGRDRATWLHGQVTQDIVNLPQGSGVYTTALTAQGQMVSDLRVFNLGETLLMDTPPASWRTLQEHLDKFLIMERARIENVTDDYLLLSLQGPEAQQVVGDWLGAEVARLEPMQIVEVEIEGVALMVTRDSHCGEDAFDLWAPVGRSTDIWGCICARCPEYGLFPIGWEALDVRRVEAGIPWWGHEMTERTVPFEARLERAIHMDKGCYVGQEVIARLHARGQVNNLLVGFDLAEGALPEIGVRVFVEGERAGRLTSAVFSHRLGRNIGLGYLRRQHICCGNEVTIGEAEAAQSAAVADLPFLAAASPETVAA